MVEKIFFNLFQSGLGLASAELLDVVRYECCNVCMTVVSVAIDDVHSLTVVISLVYCCSLSSRLFVFTAVAGDEVCLTSVLQYYFSSFITDC